MLLRGWKGKPGKQCLYILHHLLATSRSAYTRQWEEKMGWRLTCSPRELGAFPGTTLQKSLAGCQVMWPAFLGVCMHLSVILFHICAAKSISGKWSNGSASELIVCLRARARVRSEPWNYGWGWSQGPGGMYRWTRSGLAKMIPLRFALTQLRHWTSFGLVWWVPELTGLLDKFYTACSNEMS